MDEITPKNIFNLYSLTDDKDHPRLIGRVVVTASEMLVVADYDDSLQSLNGPITPQRLKRFAQWCNGSHSIGVSLQDIKEGKHPGLIPDAKVPDTDDSKPTDDSKWYKVQRDDLEDPLLIKFKEGKAYIADSDSPMDKEELNRILDLASQGKASIRHHKPVEQMLALMKSMDESEGPREDLGKHLFQDPLVPDLGSRKSFQDRAADIQPGGGVWLMLHGNDIDSIGRMHGHKTEEAATKAVGNGIVANLQGGTGYHLVGNHFMVQLPGHPQAAQFLRNLRGTLESVTPVGGTHRLSVNAGMGNHPLTAKAALKEAEKAKEAGGHLPGSAPGYAHSLIEGSEGPIAPEANIPKKA